MDRIQKTFEDWAKREGLDTLALAPSDRLYENRWYYEQTTETAYLGWRACSGLRIQAEARMEQLMDHARSILCSSQYDELEDYMHKLEQ